MTISRSKGKDFVDSDETVSVSARMLAYQRRTWVQISGLVVVVAIVAIFAVSYNNAKTQAALERTTSALNRANDTIHDLSADASCRSTAAAAESAAGWALIGRFVNNGDDPQLGDLVAALTKATAERDRVASEGCP